MYKIVLKIYQVYPVPLMLPMSVFDYDLEYLLRWYSQSFYSSTWGRAKRRLRNIEKNNAYQHFMSCYTGDCSIQMWGWSGVAMVSCILCHRGVQLKLAYSWARPAILVAGKGRGGMFLFLLFLHFHSCSYFFPYRLFHLLYYLFYLFSPFLWETTQNDPQGLTCR